MAFGVGGSRKQVTVRTPSHHTEHYIHHGQGLRCAAGLLPFSKEFTAGAQGDTLTWGPPDLLSIYQE